MASRTRKWSVSLLVLLLASTTVLTTIAPHDASALPTVPSGVLDYVPITLTNNQASPTASGFQQMLTVDWNAYGSYVNSGVTNAEFFDGSGTALKAWCESSCSSSSSSSTVWVNLGSDVVAASGGTLTIYLGFLSASANNMGSAASSVWGEAPTLSPTYAEYDDGMNVFSYYLNANSVPSVANEGTSYQSGRAETNNAGLSIVTAGGEQAVQVADSARGLDLFYFVSTPSLPSAFVATMWAYSIPHTSDNFFGVISSSTLNGYSLLSGDGGNSYLSIYRSSARVNLNHVFSPYPYSTWYSATLQLGPSGVLTGFNAPGQSLVGSGTTLTATDTRYTSFNMIFFAVYYPGAGEAMNIGSIVVRAYPPGDTMPSASFSSLIVVPSGSGLQFPLPSILPQNLTIRFNIPDAANLIGYYVATQSDMAIYNVPGFNATADQFPYAISVCYIASQNLERISGFSLVGAGDNSTEVVVADWSNVLSSATGWPAEPACSA